MGPDHGVIWVVADESPEGRRSYRVTGNKKRVHAARSNLFMLFELPFQWDVYEYDPVSDHYVVEIIE